jgi:predicted esterase
MDSGGNLALYLGFRARELVRGVAVTGGVLSGQAADSQPSQRLAFFLVAGARDPLAAAIADTRAKLTDKKFSVVYHVMADRGHEYLDAEPGLLSEMARWIDSLDRE